MYCCHTVVYFRNCVFLIGKEYTQLLISLNKKLKKVSRWLNANGLMWEEGINTNLKFITIIKNASTPQANKRKKSKSDREIENTHTK